MRILEHRTIYRDGEYVAFPNLVFLPDGRLMCAFRHAKERQKEYGKVTHIDPTAKTFLLFQRIMARLFRQSFMLLLMMK